MTIDTVTGASMLVSIDNKGSRCLLVGTSFAWCVGLLVFEWFQNNLIELIGELQVDLMLMILLLLTLAGVGLSVWHAIRRFPRDSLIAVPPIIFVAVTFWAMWHLPNLERDYYFRADRAARDHVVELVRAGLVSPDASARFFRNYYGEWHRLPTGYEYLSKLNGGDIFVDQRDGVLQVVFIDYYGIEGEFTGYVYRSDERPPVSLSPTTDPIEWVDQLDDHWFFVSVD